MEESILHMGRARKDRFGSRGATQFRRSSAPFCTLFFKGRRAAAPSRSRNVFRRRRLPGDLQPMASLSVRRARGLLLFRSQQSHPGPTSLGSRMKRIHSAQRTPLWGARSLRAENFSARACRAENDWNLFAACAPRTLRGFFGVPYLFLGLTIFRQSRSPRRRPWMSTSAVATLEAKGML